MSADNLDSFDRADTVFLCPAGILDCVEKGRRISEVDYGVIKDPVREVGSRMICASADNS